MSITCTRCEGTGFLNIHQVPDRVVSKFEETGDHVIIEVWINKNNNHDVSICDCCGDTNGWYGIPGEHYNNEDPQGERGPYIYNGGLCECH